MTMKTVTKSSLSAVLLFTLLGLSGQAFAKQDVKSADFSKKPVTTNVRQASLITSDKTPAKVQTEKKSLLNKKLPYITRSA